MQKTGNELTYDYDFYALNGLLSFLRGYMHRKKLFIPGVNALNGLLSFLPHITGGNER